MDIWIVSALLAGTIGLLITERLPVDLTALGIIAALMVTGLLSPAEAVAGFANPAVITVAAMLIAGEGMIRSGVVGFIAQKIIDGSGGNVKLALLIVIIVVSVASAFINNTPVVVLFIPIILNLSCECNFSPSKFLIPVSYASILAGTCTLIGTSTNIIVSDLSAQHGYGRLSLFELSALGVPVTLFGLAFIYLFALRFMPEHAAPVCELEGKEDKLYLTEFTVPAGSPMIEADPAVFLADRHPRLELFEIIRDSKIHYPNDAPIRMRAGDGIFVKCTANDILAIIRDRIGALTHLPEGEVFTPDHNDSRIAELVIPPQSSLLGQRLVDTRLHNRDQINIMAVKRRKLHYAEQKLAHLELRIGDILLVQCPKRTLDRIRQTGDVIIVEDVHHEIINRRKAPWAIFIFAALVAAATIGLADIMVCALTGVFAMLLSGCLKVREAYRAIQGSILLLIVGTIALGAAMEKTGAARFYTGWLMGFFADLPPQIMLGGVIVITSIGTQLLSNNATAVLLLPIAIETAAALSVSPRPFIVGVCFGASACFASPLGYQTNLLVYGPGSYRFTDYMKLGIPLNLMVIIAGTLMIPWIWPF